MEYFISVKMEVAGMNFTLLHLFLLSIDLLLVAFLALLLMLSDCILVLVTTDRHPGLQEVLL